MTSGRRVISSVKNEGKRSSFPSALRSIHGQATAAPPMIRMKLRFELRSDEDRTIMKTASHALSATALPLGLCQYGSGQRPLIRLAGQDGSDRRGAAVRCRRFTSRHEALPAGASEDSSAARAALLGAPPVERAGSERDRGL